MIAVLFMMTILFPLFALPFVFIMIFLEKNIKNKKILCVFFAGIVSYIMYKFVPNNDMDLYRYYLLMNLYSKYNIIDFLNHIFQGIEPLMNFIFYIFSKTGNNSLIMIFVSLITYMIQFYIIFDYQKEKKLNNKNLNIILLYFLSTFLIIYYISGIRFCLARIIFLLALYLDFYKDKKNFALLLLYIAPIFIHQSTIILILARILLLFNKNRFDLKFLLLFILLFMAPNIIFSFSDYISTKFSAFGLLSQRAETYLNTGNDFANIYKLQFCLMLFLFFLILKIKFQNISSNNKMIGYMLITLLIGLTFYNSSTISTRFISISTSFSPLIIMDVLDNIKKSNILIKIVLFVFSILYMVFQFIQLGLGTINNFITFEPIYILIMFFVLFIYIIFIKKKSAGDI